MICDVVTLGNKYGRETLWATAARKSRVCDGFAAVRRNDRVKTLGFVDDCSKEFHVFELSVGGNVVDSNMCCDFTHQMCGGIRLSREFPEDVGQE